MDSAQVVVSGAGSGVSSLGNGQLQPGLIAEEHPTLGLGLQQRVLVQAQHTQHTTKRKASRADDVQWGEVATNFFIDAFEERYVEINRGNFRGKDWENLATLVSARFAGEGKSFSAFQCKHKLENLKKKYRREKAAMMAAGTVSSGWQWYNRMNHLFGHAPAKVSGIAGAVDNGDQEEVERPRKDELMMDRLTDAMDMQRPDEPDEGTKAQSQGDEPEMCEATPEGSPGAAGKRAVKKKKRRSSMFNPAKDLAASFREYAQTMAEVEREKMQILRALLAHHNIIVQPSTNSES